MKGSPMWTEMPDYTPLSYNGQMWCVNCGGIATPVYRPAWSDDYSGSADICVNCANALADKLKRPKRDPEDKKELNKLRSLLSARNRQLTELRKAVEIIRGTEDE